MEIDEAVRLTQEFLYLAMILIGPAVATSLIVGVVISIFQTMTSIQEQTLSLAPKILGVAIVSAFTIRWLLNMTKEYTEQMFEKIAEIGIG